MKRAPVAKTTPAAKRAPVTGMTPNPSPSTRAAASKPSEKNTTPASNFDESSPVVVAPEVAPAPKKDAEDPTVTLVKLQSQQFAYQYAVSLRPKKPFDGVSKEIDFEHYLKKFENVLSTPGLSAKLRLAEFRFWFVKLAALKIAHFLLRKDAELAIVEATSFLKDEYGRKRTTANEMLETLMAGEKIPQKDTLAFDEFVTGLGAVYYIAVDTDRADEFDKKSLFDSVIENKLPHLRYEWVKKWSKNEVVKGPKICFPDFLSYLSRAVKIAKCTDASKTSSREVKPEVTPKASVSKSPNWTSQRSRNASHEYPSMLGPTYGQGDALSTRKKTGDAFSTNESKGEAFSTSKSLSETDLESASDAYCVLCDGSHRISECATFVALSPDERATVCRNNDLCFRCLRLGHVARACTSRGRCIVCGKPHHGALHGSTAPPTAWTPNQMTFAVKTTTPTAPQESA